MAQGLLDNRPMAHGAPSAAGLLASYGRGGDTTLAHLTPGEVVIPRSMLTHKLARALMGAAEETGHDLGRYVVGGADDSRNPNTGLLEYYDSEPGMGSGIGEGSTQTDPVGQDGRDEGDRARAAASAAAPGVGPFGGAPVGPGYQEDAYAAQYQPRNIFQRAIDWTVAQPRELMEDIRDNPGRTLANLAFNMVAPGLPSLINTGVGLIDPNMTFGGLTTRGLQAMTDYTPTPASYTEADKNADNGKPNARDDGGYPGSYGGGNGDNGPQGSKDSPLAKGGFQQQTPSSVAQSALGDALLGRPSGLNSWDGNAFTVGTDAGHPNAYNRWDANRFVIGGRQWSPAPQYSYSPTGTPYITHWAPNGLLGGA